MGSTPITGLPKDFYTCNTYILTSMPSNSDLGNYKDSPPEGSGISQERWDELGYDAQYYHYNDKRKNQIRDNQNRRREERNRIISEYKSDESCSVCDEDESKILEFHHTDDNKEFSIGEANGKGVSDERLQQEMEKCILICPNCHRKYHEGLIEIE